jgi:AcrR family transcriptional regulator
MDERESVGPLGQDQILVTALQLLADDGFHGFSMRALAAKLGVTVGATYRYFGGKEKILAAAADQILTAIPFTDGGGDWRRAFVENARAYRSTFRHYPGVAAYLTRNLGRTSISKQAIDQSLAVLIGAGLTRTMALQTAGVLNAFLRASAGDSIEPPRSGAGRPVKTDGTQVSLELDEASFQLGLDLLIGGIEKQLKGSPIDETLNRVN